MNKIELKKLLYTYKKELKDGNKEHLNDVIAIMVILDCAQFSTLDSTISEINSKNISLADLIIGCPGIKWISEYEVPDVENLKKFRRKYKYRPYWDVSSGNNYKTGAITWLEMMIKNGLINEGEIINPLEYSLKDFVTDNVDIDSKNNILSYVKKYESAKK